MWPTLENPTFASSHCRKKLPLSEMFPAASTMGPGRRVVVEALPGYGNSTLARFLAYTWATQPGYFKHR